MNETLPVTAPALTAGAGAAAIDYEGLFRRSPNAYVVLDADLRIVDMNEAYLAATMSRRDEILGRPLFEAFPSDGVNDPSVATVRDSLRRALDERRIDHLALVEYSIETGNGLEKRMWSATHTPIMDAEGRSAFVMQHTVDVTELTRLRAESRRRLPFWQRQDEPGNPVMEADIISRAKAVQAANATLTAETLHLRRLFEQAPGFMAVLRGPDHVFEIANAAYLQLVGGRDIVGKPVHEALPEVAGQGFIDLLDEVFESGKPFVGQGMSAHIQRTPGSEPERLFLDLVYQPITDLDGTAVGIFVQGHDITEQKRAESALRELNETLEVRVADRTLELEQARAALEAINANLEGIVAARMADLRAANEEIQRFAYIVSHDLRSPLVNVMGFTSELEAIRDEIAAYFKANAAEALPEGVRVAVEEDLPEAIAFIRSSTTKMDRLITAILKLSREGRRVLLSEPVVVKDLVEGFRPDLTRRMEDVGATMTVGDLPDIQSDRLALEQVFGNLLENAVKYLQPGRPGSIHVRGWSDGFQVRYAVVDNGRGIDPRDFERIFDLFRRAGTQDVPGEGIGLAHVRALVRRLGGTITVSSEPGEGTTFLLTLPKVMPHDKEETA